VKQALSPILRKATSENLVALVAIARADLPGRSEPLPVHRPAPNGSAPSPTALRAWAIAQCGAAIQVQSSNRPQGRSKHRQALRTDGLGLAGPLQDVISQRKIEGKRPPRCPPALNSFRLVSVINRPSPRRFARRPNEARPLIPLEKNRTAAGSSPFYPPGDQPKGPVGRSEGLHAAVVDGASPQVQPANRPGRAASSVARRCRAASSIGSLCEGPQRAEGSQAGGGGQSECRGSVHSGAV